jgi:hypothetical protein
MYSNNSITNHLNSNFSIYNQLYSRGTNKHEIFKSVFGYYDKSSKNFIEPQGVFANQDCYITSQMQEVLFELIKEDKVNISKIFKLVFKLYLQPENNNSDLFKRVEYLIFTLLLENVLPNSEVLKKIDARINDGNICHYSIKKDFQIIIDIYKDLKNLDDKMRMNELIVNIEKSSEIYLSLFEYEINHIKIAIIKEEDDLAILFYKHIYFDISSNKNFSAIKAKLNLKDLFSGDNITNLYDTVAMHNTNRVYRVYQIEDYYKIKDSSNKNPETKFIINESNVFCTLKLIKNIVSNQSII